jgi:hypothetical protein
VYDVERQERKILESIKKQLEYNLRMVNRLLKAAKPPRLKGEREVTARIQTILSKIKRHGGRVSRTTLGEIAASIGMAPTSVGALYGAGYIKLDPKNNGYVVLGDRAVKKV